MLFITGTAYARLANSFYRQKKSKIISYQLKWRRWQCTKSDDEGAAQKRWKSMVKEEWLSQKVFTGDGPDGSALVLSSYSLFNLYISTYNNTK